MGRRRTKYAIVEVDAVSGKTQKINRRTPRRERERSKKKKKKNSRKKKKDYFSKHHTDEFIVPPKKNKTHEFKQQQRPVNSYECIMCCKMHSLKDTSFFHCKKQRVGKTVTDKAVCFDCMLKLENRSNECPFCRSHTFRVPEIKVMGRRQKKRTKASIISQFYRTLLKRRIAEDHGFRVIGYSTENQWVELPSGFVLKFSTRDGSTPIFRHKDEHQFYEPPLSCGIPFADNTSFSLPEQMVDAFSSEDLESNVELNESIVIASQSIEDVFRTNNASEVRILERLESILMEQIESLTRLNRSIFLGD